MQMLELDRTAGTRKSYKVAKHPMLQVGDTEKEAVIGIAVVKDLRLEQICLTFLRFQVSR